ncbi:MAG TPA: ElyC/SanA/YdcF family protein [Burkholderiales bacterium]|nr:ElyC/SanA/YdcF family protein [Burkholderiales bacterium]
MFLLKKFVAPLLFPFTWCVLLLALGLALLWFTRWQKAARATLTLGVAALVVLSYGWVSDPLLRSLEWTYEPPTATALARAKWVVVLGGGTNSDPTLPLTARASSATLARLVEGVRLQRQIPGSRLLLSGAAVFGLTSDAASMAALAAAIGVPPQDIVLDDRSQDTESQAVNIAVMVKREPCLVVTSAYHLPRAMRLFAKAGVDAIPAPAQYVTGRGFAPGDLYPSGAPINAMQILVAEYLGTAWSRLRGRI